MKYGYASFIVWLAYTTKMIILWKFFGENIYIIITLWHLPHGIHSHPLYFPTFINNKFFFTFY